MPKRSTTGKEYIIRELGSTYCVMVRNGKDYTRASNLTHGSRNAALAELQALRHKA